jgi:hypothetical protein
MKDFILGRSARLGQSVGVSRLRALPVSVSSVRMMAKTLFSIPVSVVEGVCIGIYHASTSNATLVSLVIKTISVSHTMTCDCPQPKRSVKNVSRAFCSVYVARTVAIGIVK